MRSDYLIQEQELIEKYEHLKINYEADLLNPESHQKTIDRICNFLSIPSNPVVSNFKKSNQFEYKEIILNYDEVLPIIEKYS